jgi:hypothetical protein
MAQMNTDLLLTGGRKERKGSMFRDVRGLADLRSRGIEEGYEGRHHTTRPVSGSGRFNHGFHERMRL